MLAILKKFADSKSLPNNEWVQYTSMGHGCEAMAFVMNYAALSYKILNQSS